MINPFCKVSASPDRDKTMEGLSQFVVCNLELFLTIIETSGEQCTIVTIVTIVSVVRVVRVHNSHNSISVLDQNYPPWAPIVLVTH